MSTDPFIHCLSASNKSMSWLAKTVFSSVLKKQKSCCSHLKTISKIAYYHLKNIAIKEILLKQDAEKLVYALFSIDEIVMVHLHASFFI